MSLLSIIDKVIGDVPLHKISPDIIRVVGKLCRLDETEINGLIELKELIRPGITVKDIINDEE